MIDWKKLNVGDKVKYSWNEFDGQGNMNCVVTTIESDHAIVSADDMTLWLDDDNANMFTIDVGTQKCYTDTTEKEGGVDMAEEHTNAKRVEDYHKQLENIRVRFPSEEQCGVNYAKLIRDRALQLGFVNTKGKDKGTGSANAYILHLVEQDLINAGMIDGMKKGMSEVEKPKKNTDEVANDNND